MARRELDQYFTDERVARAIVARLVADGWLRFGSRVLEPHAGKGAFVEALSPHASVFAQDVDPALGWEPASDFLERGSLTPRIDAVVGNPPYSFWIEHTEQALRVASSLVAFLLPTAACSSAGRFAWWCAHSPAAEYRLFPRPSFTGGATDMREYSVFVWSTRSADHRVEYLRWR